MSPRSDRLDPRLRTAILAVAGVGAAMALGTLALAGARAATSVALGGAVAAGNLWALARIVGAVLPSSPGHGPSPAPPRRAAWALVAGPKMLGLVGLVGLLMRHGGVEPLPLLLGLGALPVGIVIGALVSDRDAPPRED